MAMRSGFLDRRPVLVGLVFLGGCLGTLIRSVIAHAWPSREDGVPWGTLAINLVGAFVLVTCSSCSSTLALTEGFVERCGYASVPDC